MIDPSILAQAQPVQVQNPLDLATKAMQLGSLSNQMQSQGYNLLAQQRALMAAQQYQLALPQAVSAGFDDKTMAALIGQNPLAAESLLKTKSDYLTNIANLAEKRALTKKEDIERQAKEMGMYSGQALQMMQLGDNLPPQYAVNWAKKVMGTDWGANILPSDPGNIQTSQDAQQFLRLAMGSVLSPGEQTAQQQANTQSTNVASEINRRSTENVLGAIAAQQKNTELGQAGAREVPGAPVPTPSGLPPQIAALLSNGGSNGPSGNWQGNVNDMWRQALQIKDPQERQAALQSIFEQAGRQGPQLSQTNVPQSIAPPSNVQQNVEMRTPTLLEKNLSDKYAKDVETIDNNASGAALLKGRVNEMRGLLSQFSPNAAAPVRQKAAEIALALGANKDVASSIAGGDVSAMQTFFKNSVQMAFEAARTQMGGVPRAYQEIEYQLKANPNVALTPEANAMILDFLDGVNNYSLAKQNAKDAWLNAHADLKGFEGNFNTQHPATEFLPDSDRFKQAVGTSTNTQSVNGQAQTGFVVTLPNGKQVPVKDRATQMKMQAESDFMKSKLQ